MSAEIPKPPEILDKIVDIVLAHGPKKAAEPKKKKATRAAEKKKKRRTSKEP